MILLLPSVSHALDPSFRRTCAKGTAPLVSVVIAPPLDTAAKLFAAYPCAMFVYAVVNTSAVSCATVTPPDRICTLVEEPVVTY